MCTKDQAGNGGRQEYYKDTWVNIQQLAYTRPVDNVETGGPRRRAERRATDPEVFVERSRGRNRG